MTAPDLKPCPFCGGEAHIEQIGDRRQSTIYCCNSCGCRLETGEEWDHGRNWNTRHSPLAEALAVPEVAALEIWKLANTRDPDDPVFLAALRAIGEGRNG